MPASLLANSHRQLAKENGIYVDAQRVRPDSLSSYLTITVPKLFSRVSDLSLFSYELEQALDTPELLHEFDGAAHNVLRVCDFDSIGQRKNALDLSQDMGGASHFLAKYFSSVDSVFTCLGRANQAVTRTAVLDKVSVFCLDVEEIEYSQASYDFIYLGGLDQLGLSKAQGLNLIQRLTRSLSKGGILVFNSLNYDRLSKSLSTRRYAHQAQTPYLEIYQDQADTGINLEDLDAFLDSFQSNQVAVYASFSAKGTQNNLFAQEYLDDNPNALNHFYRLGSIDNDQLNEYLLYKKLTTDGHDLISYASSFTVMMGDEHADLARLYDNDFTHFPGRSRLPQWRAITFKPSAETTVYKHVIDTDYAERKVEISELIAQQTSPQPFESGQLLIDQWLQTVLHNDAKRFEQLVKEYYDWLESIQADEDFNASAYDLLPFNIIVSEEGYFRAIDPEWKVHTDINPSFVLFRALFWFAFENRAMMIDFADTWSFSTLGGFVRHYLNFVSTDQDIHDYIQLEEQIQKNISHEFSAGSIAAAMQHGFSAQVAISSAETVRSEITWADKNDVFDQANTVSKEWRAASSPQELVIAFKTFDGSKRRLRVDPIDNSGVFSIQALSLLDTNERIVWQLDPVSESAVPCQLQNMVTVDQSNACYAALNDDPFFLFDLSEIPQLEQVASVRLSLSLHCDPIFQNALSQLQKLVDEQAQSLLTENNKGHERQADNDILTARLLAAEDQCLHLKRQLAEFETVKADNERMHQALLRSPTARIKRLIKRLMS